MGLVGCTGDPLLQGHGRELMVAKAEGPYSSDR